MINIVSYLIYEKTNKTILSANEPAFTFNVSFPTAIYGAPPFALSNSAVEQTEGDAELGQGVSRRI